MHTTGSIKHAHRGLSRAIKANTTNRHTLLTLISKFPAAPLSLLSLVSFSFSLILKHSLMDIQTYSNKIYAYSSNIQTDLPIISHLPTQEQNYSKTELHPFILRKQTRNQTETNAGSEARNMNTDALNEAQKSTQEGRIMNSHMNQQQNRLTT